MFTFEPSKEEGSSRETPSWVNETQNNKTNKQTNKIYVCVCVCVCERETKVLVGKTLLVLVVKHPCVMILLSESIPGRTDEQGTISYIIISYSKQKQSTLVQ